MAIRTWGRSLLVALGVSLLAGAGQLGIAYGLGLLRFTRSFAHAPGHWPAQLVWVGWVAVGATLVGAVLAERYARRDGLPVTAVVQATIAVAATLGATVVAPLCMLPARNAQVPSAEPVLAVAVSALFGALTGSVAAFAVLRYAPVRWNVVASTATLWLLALLSVVPSLGATESLRVVRLGTTDPAWLAPDTAGRLAMVILPGMALVFGAAVAGLERRHGQPPLLGVVSGVAGPLLVAVVYLLAGTGRGDAYQSTPYRAALVAVLAGSLGAAGAALLGRPPLTAANLLRWPALVRGRSRSDAIAPTEILRPLPVGTDLPPVAAPTHPTADTDPPQTVTVVPAGPDAPTRPEPTPARPDTPPHLEPDPARAPHPVPTGLDGPPGRHTPEPGATGTEEAGKPPVEVGHTPAERLDWRFPQAPGTVRSPAGAQPVPPGSAETVSTAALDWSLPGQGRHAADGASDRVYPGPTVGDDGPAGSGPVADAAPTGGPAAGSPDDQDAGPAAGGLRRLRGLLRRDRGGQTAGDRSAAEPALAPQDEEYVDWVAQLGQPMADATSAGDPDDRRTLRSGGRHQPD